MVHSLAPKWAPPDLLGREGCSGAPRVWCSAVLAPLDLGEGCMVSGGVFWCKMNGEFWCRVVGVFCRAKPGNWDSRRVRRSREKIEAFKKHRVRRVLN